MKITVIGKDLIEVNETTSENYSDKIHLIHLNFVTPTREKIENVLKKFKSTNRFIISNHIKIYNDILKLTGKKYYVANTSADKILSFLRKNNKILFDFTCLGDDVASFMLDKYFDDILSNSEVIRLNKSQFNQTQIQEFLSDWNGNVILV